MSLIMAFLLAAVALCVLGYAFLRTDAEAISRAIHVAGPAVVGSIGVICVVTGHAALGGILVAGSAAVYGYLRTGRRALRRSGQRSTVRTAALEMELDHDTGQLEGSVLAGTFEGQLLGTLDMDDLVLLLEQLSSDPDSVRLLEAYLDSRFPTWRRYAEAKVGARMRRTPVARAMSKEEAYKILGLEASASAADIREAHRRLMQRLQPHRSKAIVLAARINEAKDVLLSHHD